MPDNTITSGLLISLMPLFVIGAVVLIALTALAIKKLGLFEKPSKEVNINNPKIMINVSLPKPAKAIFAGRIPLMMSVSIIPRAMISEGTRSSEKRMMATVRITSINRI